MPSQPPSQPPSPLPSPPTRAPEDPYLWLEDVEADRALTWVRAQNSRTEAELGARPGFAGLEHSLVTILDSDQKIPYVRKVREHYYNFWQDSTHVRGLWRRTTWDSYVTDEPAWETVLDLDALSEEEGVAWVWHGASFLRPERVRCLLALSRGGSDADVTREFDVERLAFVDGGFDRPEAKGELDWIDLDHVYVSTDFGPDSMTESGYPRIVKQWTRGTPLADASVVFEGKPSDIYVAAYHDDTPGFERDFVARAPFYFSTELFLREGERLTKIDAPDSANKSVRREWLLVRPREEWTVGETSYPPGSLLAAPLEEYVAGRRELTVLFTPDEHSSLQSWTWTLNRLVLNVLVDVKSRLTVLTPGKGDWSREEFVGTPELGTIDVSAVDGNECDDVWVISTDFLHPTTLSHATVGAEPRVLKTMPSFFDGSDHLIEQRFTTSDDGTRVPYFVVRPKELALDGTAPTLLHGYGGFEVAQVPAYSGLIGKGWLEGGGVYAVANIRGGGEYGPSWHLAGFRENRHLVYEDFAAVARDLVATGITSPRHLAASGGSNGGLLVGNMLTTYPELFGALVIQVPLLDMRRYTKLLAGASWMEEYGDPDDPDDWEFLQRYSPYHRFDPARDYPPTMIWTTTRDDRVHPGHARKMAALMGAAGKDVRYFESIEGGHGAGATNAQVAHVWALDFEFLRAYIG
ncbi:MAG: prolyl oligopeptidase family serine peptidase [Nocardioidaceae bacterium]